jgi:hypothetical protein
MCTLFATGEIGHYRGRQFARRFDPLIKSLAQMPQTRLFTVDQSS